MRSKQNVPKINLSEGKTILPSRALGENVLVFDYSTKQFLGISVSGLLSAKIRFDANFSE